MITINLAQIGVALLTLLAMAGWAVAYWQYKTLSDKFNQELSKVRSENLINLASIKSENEAQLYRIETENEAQLKEISDLADSRIRQLEQEYMPALELYEKYITSMDMIIQVSAQKIREVDARGVYKTDDEVEFFFEALKEIQANLDKFQIEKQDLDSNQ
jgi:biopolymer transport protein ExbB/TolQ